MTGPDCLATDAVEIVSVPVQISEAVRLGGEIAVPPQGEAAAITAYAMQGDPVLLEAMLINMDRRITAIKFEFSSD